MQIKIEIRKVKENKFNNFVEYKTGVNRVGRMEI